MRNVIIFGRCTHAVCSAKNEEAEKSAQEIAELTCGTLIADVIEVAEMKRNFFHCIGRLDMFMSTKSSLESKISFLEEQHDALLAQHQTENEEMLRHCQSVEVR